jgi:hypothetical protein
MSLNEKEIEEQLKAVDEALSDADKPPHRPVVEDDDPPDPEVKAEGEESVTDDPDAVDPDAEPDPDKPATDADDPDAAAKPAGDEADPDKPAEPDPEKPAAPDDTKRPSDEFGELPEETKEKTRKRFDTMRERFDEVSNELTEIKQNYEHVAGQQTEWQGVLEESTAQPEQLAAALNFIRAFNEGTPQSLEQAYEIMSVQMKEIATLLGKEIPGVDPLEGFDDLQKRIEDGFLEREDAVQIANARRQQEALKANSTQSHQTRQQTAVRNRVLNDISGFGQEIQAKHPEKFKRYIGTLEAVIASTVRSNAPPDQWLPSIQQVWDALPNVVAAVPPPKKDAPNPLTGGPGAPSSKLKKEPQNMLEAVDDALREMGAA